MPLSARAIPVLAAVLALPLAATADDPCASTPMDAALEVLPPEGAGHVHVVVELHAAPTASRWTAASLDALATRGLRGVVVIDVAHEDADGYADWLAPVVEAGHEVALWRPDGLEVGADVLRAQAKRTKRWAGGRPHAVVSDLPTGLFEANLQRVGMWTLLSRTDTGTSVPRAPARLEGQPALAAVIPARPY